jgi:hypothetical protein
MGIAGSTGRVIGLAAAGLLTAATLAACGSDDSSTVAQDPGGAVPSTPGSSADQGGSPPQGPTCGSVWKKDAKLPTVYRGCASDSKWIKAEVYQCSDGHRLVTFDHVFYASPGRTISRAATTLAKDQDFQQTMAVCGA